MPMIEISEGVHIHYEEYGEGGQDGHLFYD